MTHIRELRDSLAHGATVNQLELDTVIEELNPQKASLRPKDKEELLPLFDTNGKALDTFVPRWICHVLALRHRCAHVLLIWRSQAMGDTLILQIRSWDKDDSPGRLDISVGGHMTANVAEVTALAEMLQETNLTIDDLEGSTLHLIVGYPFDEEPRPAENFYNSEWRDVYVGYMKHDGLERIKFPDGEVAGIMLLPLKDAQQLLQQHILPMASALTHSLPVCLRNLNNG